LGSGFHKISAKEHSQDFSSLSLTGVILLMFLKVYKVHPIKNSLLISGVCLFAFQIKNELIQENENCSKKLTLKLFDYFRLVILE